MYTFLLEKRATTYIARSGIIPQTKVIEKARLLGRIDNDSDSLVYIFLMIGLFIALISTVLKQLFFNKIETIKELNSATDFPILGAVPFVEMEKENLLPEIISKSYFAESLRNIRTSLNFFTSNEADVKLKSFLISSIHPGEGKTFMSVNLSRIISKTGK